MSELNLALYKKLYLIRRAEQASIRGNDHAARSACGKRL